jgi:tripartite-type tricarboxylate transporter receptor subunit TctC
MTTTFSTSRRRALKLGLAATLAAPAVARAQQGWPSGPITWVNPFPAGGGTDVFARPLAAQVGEQLGC